MERDERGCVPPFDPTGGPFVSRLSAFHATTIFRLGLVAIKVGLDIGVIGNQLFTMLMVMAIVTTIMTGPLLTLFAGRHAAAPHGETV